jgi:hypothetical protein
VLEFNTESDEEGWVSLVSVQRASISNTFYWHEYGLGPDGTGIPFLTVTAADGTYNRWYSIRIERVDDGTNTGATIKIYVDGTLVVNETLTYQQDARRGRIGNSIRYTYRRNSTSPSGAGVAIDNFKLTAGIAPSSVVDVNLANLQRNNANLLSFIKGKVPTVNDATLTIQKNGDTVGTFSANSSSNKTVNIQCVDLTSNQTVAGDKEFTGNVSIEKSNDSPTTLSDTSLALTGTSQYIFFRTKGSSNYKSYNSFLWGGYLTGATPYRYGRIRLYRASAIYGETGDETPDISFSFIDVALHYKWVSLTDNVKFINDGTTNACVPLTNNATDLGTSTNKWKTFNGINPGALSLPGTFVNIDTTNWVLDGSNVNIFTPASDGWLGIQAIDTVYDQMHYIFVGRNDSTSYYQQNALSPINALWDGEYHGCVFIPVVKGLNYDIRCICSTIVATFYPCQGNV